MELVENIKKDNFFYLQNSKDYEIRLKEGITEFVDQFGKNFRDMTYVQLAIALRKPNCLKGMLETSYFKCQIPFQDIITPKTSNTKGNIISLSIEFGSENSQYDFVDTNCLKVIIDFGNNAKEKNNENFNIDIENINGETPLIRAINYQNTEACEILIQNGANILHKSENNQFLMSPLRYLFLKAANISILQKIISRDLLTKDTYDKCLKEIESEDFRLFIQNTRNETSKEFIKYLLENEQERKRQIEAANAAKSQASEPNTSEAHPKQKKKECKGCHKVLQSDDTHEFNGELYCEECYDKLIGI